MPKPKIPRNVLIVAFVALASGFGQDLITPILPSFLIAIGVGHSGIGIIDGLLQGATSIFRFVSGILSDKFQNRKWFVFFGYALSSLARPLLFLSNSFGSVAALRTIDGIGKGTKDAPRDALVADSATVENRGRAFGFQRLIDTAGSVLGPLAAAGLLFWLTPSLGTYRFIFLLAAIPGLIALGLIFFGIKEPEKKVINKNLLHQPFPWQFWFFVIGMTLAMFTKINDSLFLTRAQEIGVSSNWIPVLFAGFTLVYALMSYPIGIWSDRFGKLPFIIGGWLVMSLVEFGFAHESSIGTALGLFAFYGLFYALTEGSGRAIIADLVPAEDRGSAYAIYNTFIGLAVILGGYGLGHLWDSVSPHYAFSISSYGSFFGFLILLLLWWKNKKKIVV
ncbi:MAG: MFS transporter [Candidatus Magasanikbacteria bacterium]|nr:MFS transporter [Candidatus Magasanikbacteria bacterium]